MRLVLCNVYASEIISRNFFSAFPQVIEKFSQRTAGTDDDNITRRRRSHLINDSHNPNRARGNQRFFLLINSRPSRSLDVIYLIKSLARSQKHHIFQLKQFNIEEIIMSSSILSKFIYFN